MTLLSIESAKESTTEKKKKILKSISNYTTVAGSDAKQAETSVCSREKFIAGPHKEDGLLAHAQTPQTP